jgi:CRISPR-associated protein Cas1
MVRTNLQEIPRYGDKLSYAYIDRAVLEQDGNALAAYQADGVTRIPVAGLATLILGPGTKITHEAVKCLADNNCLVIWSGDHGVRFYAQGLGAARHSRNVIHQARLVSNEVTRLQVVVRMYCLRFQEPPDPGLNLQQLRGKEGVRVRQAYADAAKTAGVKWEGRNYQRQDWFAGDPLNRALSAGNACLYGLAHAAILSAGYSPALGFIHTGKQLSFVYDIADLYKVELVVPLAFALAKGDPPDLEHQVRSECRRRFRGAKLMDRIIPDLARVLDVECASQEALEDEFINDSALPAELWQPLAIPADLPIGRILKLDPLQAGMPGPGGTNGGADSGQGPARTAG